MGHTKEQLIILTQKLSVEHLSEFSVVIALFCERHMPLSRFRLYFVAAVYELFRPRISDTSQFATPARRFCRESPRQRHPQSIQQADR